MAGRGQDPDAAVAERERLAPLQLDIDVGLVELSLGQGERAEERLGRLAGPQDAGIALPGVDPGTRLDPHLLGSAGMVQVGVGDQHGTDPLPIEAQGRDLGLELARVAPQARVDQDEPFRRLDDISRGRNQPAEDVHAGRHHPREGNQGRRGLLRESVGRVRRAREIVRQRDGSRDEAGDGADSPPAHRMNVTGVAA